MTSARSSSRPRCVAARRAAATSQNIDPRSRSGPTLCCPSRPRSWSPPSACRRSSAGRPARRRRCRRASRSRRWPPGCPIRGTSIRCPTATSSWSNDSARDPSRSTGPRTRSATSSCRWRTAAAEPRRPPARRRTAATHHLAARRRRRRQARAQDVLLDHLNSPFGVALVGNDLYVADTDAILRYPFTPGQTTDHRARPRR